MVDCKTIYLKTIFHQLSQCWNDCSEKCYVLGLFYLLSVTIRAYIWETQCQLPFYADEMVVFFVCNNNGTDEVFDSVMSTQK